MYHIVIIAGGTSPERAVSLRSGAAVAKALAGRDYRVSIVDPVDGIEKHEAELRDADAVFPIIHGLGGEDGHTQALLEHLCIPYVGTGSEASAVCFDKPRAIAALKQVGIVVPAGEIVTIDTIWKSPLAAKPFVLKPYDGGSSIDTFIVRNAHEADKPKIEQALRAYKKMLLEELIAGIELTVGVLGDKALTPVEIVPPEGGEFDYENKYNGKTGEFCPPKNIPKTKQEEAKALAARIHDVLGCRDMSRTDLIMDKNGVFYAIETNTLPGMTDQSLYPKAAKDAGLSMEELCDQLVRMALSRARE